MLYVSAAFASRVRKRLAVAVRTCRASLPEKYLCSLVGLFRPSPVINRSLLNWTGIAIYVHAPTRTTVAPLWDLG
jgi:hypothetical protein